MKRGFVLLLVAGILWSATVLAEEHELIASKFSDRYHEPSCKIVKKIYPDEKLIFKSVEEAKAQGYGPCKKCHPEAREMNFGHK